MIDKYKITVINGPNLNMLGIREPDKYGNQTLENIIHDLKIQAKKFDIKLHHFQSNSESMLINYIQNIKDNTNFIIVNLAAFTHTSIALRDTLLAVSIPFIEVHISNIYKREFFRHYSYLSDIALGVICGLGIDVYQLALQAAIKHLNKLN